MDENFIRTRIAKLRTDKNISARELSIELGQSPGYINAIENGISLPSMRMFLYLCVYFHIEPMDFFNEGIEYPILVTELIKESKRLDDTALKTILSLMKQMPSK